MPDHRDEAEPFTVRVNGRQYTIRVTPLRLFTRSPRGWEDPDIFIDNVDAELLIHDPGNGRQLARNVAAALTVAWHHELGSDSPDDIKLTQIPDGRRTARGKRGRGRR